MASMSVQSTMALTCCIRQGKKSVFVKQYGEDQSVWGDFGSGMGC